MQYNQMNHEQRTDYHLHYHPSARAKFHARILEWCYLLNWSTNQLRRIEGKPGHVASATLPSEPPSHLRADAWQWPT